jgi:hypothetical protein
MAHEAFLQRFKDTFLAEQSDVNGFMKLIDKDCVWTIEATGEVFRGWNQVKELADRSVAARNHTKDVQMVVSNEFVTNDSFVIEYTHGYFTTDKWTASTDRPALGTKVFLPICVVAHFKGEKLDWLHEYFDLATVSGKQGKLYS